jgi:hypothetical protein
MARQKITRRQILKGGAAAGVLGALGAPGAVLAHGDDDDDDDGKRIRWDIVNILTPCVSPGGHASARAQDGARITIRGSGTFPAIRNRCSRHVTGGGTWEIMPGTAGTATGCFDGHGTFRVTELLSWVPAPGVLPLPCDDIGRLEDVRAGLAKLRVRYSNRQTGVLTVSCHLVGTADCVFEGITTSMSYEDFWNPEPPAPGVDANRTLFHVVRDKDKDN